jgi:hypothetical protein
MTCLPIVAGNDPAHHVTQMDDAEGGDLRWQEATLTA